MTNAVASSGASPVAFSPELVGALVLAVPDAPQALTPSSPTTRVAQVNRIRKLEVIGSSVTSADPRTAIDEPTSPRMGFGKASLTNPRGANSSRRTRWCVGRCAGVLDSAAVVDQAEPCDCHPDQ